MRSSAGSFADPLLDLLAPFWQGLIGATVVLAVAVAAIRLAHRGQSRMTTALLVIGGAIIALTVIGMLVSA